MSRGGRWFGALAGRSDGPVASVLCADGEIGGERARFLAVVPDPESPFRRARNGEVGLREGWTLAGLVRQAVEEDGGFSEGSDAGGRRALVAVVDVPSQAYGRLEETAGLHLSLAAASDAYARARIAGHPVVALIVGRALSGGFLAHGFQANRILALDDPGVGVHAMGKEAAARVTLRTVEQLERFAETGPTMSYNVRDWASLGLCEPLLRVRDADDPGPEDVREVKDALAREIREIREGPRDLRGHLESPGAREYRGASILVRERLAAEWD